MPAINAHIDLGTLRDIYDASEATRELVSHNIGVFKCIRGGLRIAERHRIAFDPRGEYWRLPERRLGVAYFADRWTGRFAPALALRIVAQRLLAHLDQARPSGIVSYRGVEYESAGGLQKICSDLAVHVRSLPPIREWEQLRAVWPKVAPTAGEDLSNFLLAVPTTEEWERGFARRLPWLGYLGANSSEDLQHRQTFFFGYANLWTTTNAYVHAGAQNFAPVIQNTPTDRMLDAALQWATGTNPIATTFRTIGRGDEDDEPQDRSRYSTVVEVYGFLNLERAPFYNNLAERYRDWFGIARDINPYEMTATVGKVTSKWLAENPAAVEHLLALFRTLADQRWTTRVEIETVESPRIKKRTIRNNDDLLDTQFFEELEKAAQSELMRLSDRDAASLTLHLLLDSKLYLESSREPIEVTTSPNPAPPFKVAARAPSQLVFLPPALRPYGERALAYLKAGFHVLFAGPPGTGKTTLAQFVGYAWDRSSDVLPEQMPIDAAPLTTVGNSAWSPFHTIGGLMPTEKGTFTSHAGIFIDPDSTGTGAWRLRNGAVVLDEMNRADLDRCIGELYPLLSCSVQRVSPAGLPTVKSIEACSHFRVLATVNDAHLDDIVFPISEGLARRFQRIELPGGSRDEVLAYLGIDGAELGQDERRTATREAVRAFFEVAREHQLLVKAEDDDILPFGVAYFGLLKRWIEGQLEAPLSELTTPEQARDLLAACLRTLGRTRKWNEAVRTYLAKA